MRKIDLEGKKALVTGGGQGIGAGICVELAACGADIGINYLHSKEKAEVLAKQLQNEYGVKAFCVKANVADAEQVKEMFAQIDKNFGGIDILVNNAGIETNKHVLELGEDEWDLIHSVNLKGPFLCAQEAGKRMEKSGGGAIINISTIHDQTPRKGLAHYCSSKAGLKMLTKSLALELAEFNIRVNTVSPGAIYTEMNREEIKEFGEEKFNNWIPQGRIGEVAEVTPCVAFLASDMASYITGTEIYIDGAYLLSMVQYDPRPPRGNTEE
jgi:glucose 1-dehydrogenase